MSEFLKFKGNFEKKSLKRKFRLDYVILVFLGYFRLGWIKLGYFRLFKVIFRLFLGYF